MALPSEEQEYMLYILSIILQSSTHKENRPTLSDIVKPEKASPSAQNAAKRDTFYYTVILK